MSRTPTPKPLGEDEPRRSDPSGMGEEEILDLCSTCNSMDLCLSKKTLKRPIHFCEEFDAWVPEPVRPLRAVPERKKENGGYTGICINCDNRRICINSRGEGGIWHCENYA